MHWRNSAFNEVNRLGPKNLFEVTQTSRSIISESKNNNKLDVELLAEPKTDVSDMERNSTNLDFSDDSLNELAAGFSGEQTIEKNTTDYSVVKANAKKGPNDNNSDHHSNSKRRSRKRNKR